MNRIFEGEKKTTRGEGSTGTARLVEATSKSDHIRWCNDLRTATLKVTTPRRTDGPSGSKAIQGSLRRYFSGGLSNDLIGHDGSNMYAEGISSNPVDPSSR